MATDTRAAVEKALAAGNGILRLEPAWVARDFLPTGRRLGLKESEYNITFFGPDIKTDVPMIPRYGSWPASGK